MKKTKNQQTTQNKPHKKRLQTPRSLVAFFEHTRESSGRLFWITCSILGAAVVAFELRETLLSFITAPLQAQPLVYAESGGALNFIFASCLFFGVFVTIPLIAYHIYRFFEPVLEHAGFKFLSITMLSSIVLALSGAVYGYGVAFPAMLAATDNNIFQSLVVADTYLSFVAAYTVGMALLFQLPLLLAVIGDAQTMTFKRAMKSQRYVVVGSLVAAAMMTPTLDVLNMLMVGLPIVLAYQLGVLAVYIRSRKVSVDSTHELVDIKTEIEQEELSQETEMESSADVALQAETNNDEIPAAILAEFENKSTEEPAAMEVEIAEKTSSVAEISPVETVANVAVPAPAPVQTQQLNTRPIAVKKPAMRRSIDGVSFATASMPRRVTLPVRPSLASRPTSHRQALVQF